MKIFKEIDLIQGSENWLKWRKKHVTATDSAKIMGKNPWTPAIECYNEKIEGKKTFVNAAMQRGMDLEPIARDKLVSMFGVSLRPLVIESVEYPFLGASLDAISFDNTLLIEIKCVGEKTMNRALKGEIDPMYIIQCQKQLAMTGLEVMHIFYYFNSSIYCSLPIARNEKMIKQILKSDTAFWENHIVPQIPPEKYGDDFARIDAPFANRLAIEWLTASLREKDAKAEKDKAAEELKQYTNGKNCLFLEAGIKHLVIEKKGLVDWKKVQAKLQIPDDVIESYRKESTSYSKFSDI